MDVSIYTVAKSVADRGFTFIYWLRDRLPNGGPVVYFDDSDNGAIEKSVLRQFVSESLRRSAPLTRSGKHSVVVSKHAENVSRVHGFEIERCTSETSG